MTISGKKPEVEEKNYPKKVVLESTYHKQTAFRDGFDSCIYILSLRPFCKITILTNYWYTHGRDADFFLSEEKESPLARYCH